MPLQIGGSLDPCPPCKIILNGGFMAALAPILASRTLWHSIRISATHLAEAATAYTQMLAAVGIAVTVVGDWDGCEQATLLLGWIWRSNEEGEKVSPLNSEEGVNAAREMEKWADALLGACAELAAGKIPK